MALTGIMGSIAEVESLDEQCIDATIYTLGTNQNLSYDVPYADLTDEQKAIVDSFRQLIIDLAPPTP